MFMSSVRVETTCTLGLRGSGTTLDRSVASVAVVRARQGGAHGVRGVLLRWLEVREWLSHGYETTRVWKLFFARR